MDNIKNKPMLIRWRKRILGILFPVIWHISRPISRAYNYVFPIDPHGRSIEELVGIARATAELTPDFFLVMYQDTWRKDGAAWKRKYHLPIMWGGIRFIPYHDARAGREGYFKDKNFRGLCMMDKEAVNLYETRRPKNIFTLCPDITNIELPERVPEFVTKMLYKANGRRIVLLCGSIEGRKNVQLFCRLASMADPFRWFFALVGQMHLGTFSNEDQAAVTNFISEDDGNTFFHEGFLPDERDLNAVINASDVIFAVYRDFRISSNMTTKASYFEKPILVGDRYLMGEHVRRYRIGRTVPEDNATAMMAALEDLVANPVPKVHFNSCRADFNEEKMGDALEKFIKSCVERKE